jgi:hypothetical protein
MKGLFSKVMIVITGAIALFGISVANVKASLPDITSKSALYLEHGKQINSDMASMSWHSSHVSHGSHGSHGSHFSHESHASHSSGY